jgi:imidazolonepropionase-like amidohydrolase
MSEKLLFKRANLYPVTSKPLYETDLLVQNGTIAEISRSILEKEADRVIECKDKYIFPGLIDVHTHVGLYDEGTGWAGNDANESIEPITPHIRAFDSCHPFDPAFKDAVMHGITAVHIMPGSANVIGGTTSVIKTAGTTLEEMMIKQTAGLKIALGENPKRIHSHGAKESITRMGIMGMLREAFYSTRHNGGNDFRKMPIQLALEKKIPVRIHAHRADDILSAIRFSEEFELDYRIEHCTEGHLIASILAEKKAKVSIGPTLTRRSKVELKNKSWSTYRILAEAGIDISITTDHPYTPIQYLNLAASIAVREGMEEQSALEAITINPAKNLGIDDRMGSLEPGKDANFSVWSGHLFHYLAKPVLTLIDGKIVYQAEN